ncbi:MAG: hypothetical protein RLZZ488_952 [Pseudomonadota bacterium]|jgi:type II secretion system protein N
MDTQPPKGSLLVEDLPVLAAQKEIAEEAVSMIAAPARSQYGADLFGDFPQLRIRKSKRAKLIAIYAAVGFVSFLFFLYLSFPINVVKEVAVSKVNELFIQRRMPVRLSVASLKFKFPVGVSLEDIQVMNVTDSDATVKIGRVAASLNVLPIFVGKIDASLRVTQSGGSLDVNVSDSLYSLFKLATAKNVRLPSGQLAVTFTNFEIKSLVANALAYVRAQDSPNLKTIEPFLKTEIGGQLTGLSTVELPPAGESFEKARANIDVKLVKAYLAFRDESIQIPQQDFSAARIRLNLAKKSLEITQDTKFIANDIGVDVAGRVNISDSLAVNDVNLKLALTLKGKLEEQFKYLLPAVFGCDQGKMVDGKMDFELSGSFGALACR